MNEKEVFLQIQNIEKICVEINIDAVGGETSEIFSGFRRLKAEEFTDKKRMSRFKMRKFIDVVIILSLLFWE